MASVNELFPELATNPVGWSRRAPAQFLSAAPNAAFFDPLTTARLPGAARPLTQSELAGAADFSQQLFGAASNALGLAPGQPGVPSPRVTLARVRPRARWQAPPKGPIRAWHASPHHFHRFDMGKIGTGEGNQTYGKGLYIAQNPRVAAEYYDTFKDARGGYHFKQFGNVSRNDLLDFLATRGYLRSWADENPALLRELGDIWKSNLKNVLGGELTPAILAQDDYARGMLMRKAVGSGLSAMRGASGPESLTGRLNFKRESSSWLLDKNNALWRDYATSARIVPLLKREGVRYRPQANLYRVQFNAAPDELLDYNRALLQQPDGVLERLHWLASKEAFSNGPGYASRRALELALEDVGLDPRQILGDFNALQRARRSIPASAFVTGDALRESGIVPRHVYSADVLGSAGIPGMQYLDWGSRNMPVNSPLATRNYVVFDPSKLEILKRYTPALGPVSGGVAANMLFGGDANAAP